MPLGPISSLNPLPSSWLRKLAALIDGTTDGDPIPFKPTRLSSPTVYAADSFGHQNQYTGQGGVMLHCPDCTAEHCPCMAK